MKLLQVNNLKTYFSITGGAFRKQTGLIKAVDGVSFYLKSGETLGLVGESGCGKSTLAKSVLKLIKDAEGEVIFEQENIFNLKDKALRLKRADLQMVFQDPIASLNPKMKIKEIVSEPLLIHTSLRKKERIEKINELLSLTGLSKDYINRFPHQLSGGERQRIGIARALATDPKLIICDEPVSSLDLSIQAQVLNLLVELQNKFKLAYLFITHDISVVSYISDRIMVMYRGKIVELSHTEELTKNPLHPYTKNLLSASSDYCINYDKIYDKQPYQEDIKYQCSFYSRCKDRLDKCKREIPPLSEKAPAHFIACHRI